MTDVNNDVLTTSRSTIEQSLSRVAKKKHEGDENAAKEFVGNFSFVKSSACNYLSCN